MECGRTVSPFPHAHSTSRLTSRWQANHRHSGQEAILSIFRLTLTHRELFTLMQGRAPGSWLIFLTQSRVKEGCNFWYGGLFSLSHAICRSMVVFHPFMQRTSFPLALLSCVLFFHPSWWIVSCRLLCFLPGFSWAVSFSLAHRLRVVLSPFLFV